jgi:hypothetical protein
MQSVENRRQRVLGIRAALSLCTALGSCLGLDLAMEFSGGFGKRTRACEATLSPQFVLEPCQEEPALWIIEQRVAGVANVGRC